MLGKRGLFMLKHEDAVPGMKELLGHVMRAVAGTVSVPPSRAWRLRDALHASRLRKMSDTALVVLLRHSVFCLVLAIRFEICFAFVHAHCDSCSEVGRD